MENSTVLLKNLIKWQFVVSSYIQNDIDTDVPIILDRDRSCDICCRLDFCNPYEWNSKCVLSFRTKPLGTYQKASKSVV